MEFRIIFTFLIGLLLTSNISAQDTIPEIAEDSVEEVIPPIENKSYFDEVRTVLLYSNNSRWKDQIISTHPSSKFTLMFDDLRNDLRDLYFRIEHCDKDWRPTGLPEREIFESNQSRLLEENEWSNGTRVEYNQYKINLPREGERFLRSGNYVIHIYEEEPDSLVLTQRFMVAEPGVNISGNVSQTDDVKFRDYRQQVKFEISDSQEMVEDISRLYVRIMKNNSPMITCEDPKPSFVNDGVLTYERINTCGFDGGNEYRYFNMIQFRSISNNIVKVDIRTRRFYQLWLDVDRPRSYLKYVSQPDHNGKSLYTGDSQSFLSNELDYAMVYFTLETEEALFGHELYVYGEFTNYQVQERYKMIYSADRQQYETSAFLKQGLYNYQYVVKSIYQDGPDESLIEGSHAETENDYIILVYYSNPFEGHDQLIGVQRLNSLIRNRLIEQR